LARWSFRDVRALVEQNNRRPRQYLVPLGIDVDEAARSLAHRGMRSERVGGGTRCLRLGEGVTPSAALEVLPQALIQDPAAHLVVLYGDVPEGTKVADLCAAPGSKAIAVADRADSIWAADRSEVRLRMVRENARRTGRLMGFVVADARHPPFRGVDVVLLDAPCTGTGTLQRHPDARWRLRASSLGDLVNLQREMMDAGASVVPPGGILLYSTCSLENEENEDQVAAFLRRHQDFVIEATGAVPERYTDALGCLVIKPQDTGFDGAFAARLRRVA